MSLAAEVGAPAPNFDLASTEGVVIMLRDEVPRSGIVLYAFAGDLEAGVEEDLRALQAQTDRFADVATRVLVVSSLDLATLAEAQARLGLRFPLLRDDRSFLASYGIGDDTAKRGLFLVGRDGSILWQSRPLGSVAEAQGTLLAELSKMPRSTTNYPKSILNRLVDRLQG